MNDASSGHLARLDDLDDLKVADGYENVRGWSVHGSDGRKAGEVKHLVADPVAMRVRYLEIELDDSVRAADASGARRALLPIGAVRIDDRDDHVLVDTLASTELSGLPTYADGTPITRAYETTLRDRFTTGAAGAAAAGSAGAAGLVDTHAGDDFYAHHAYDETRFLSGKRAGGVTDGGRAPRPIDEDMRADL